MGFLDGIRKALKGGSASGSGGGGASSFGDDKRSYWVYARCQRCGELLKSRVDLFNEPSEDDDGSWIVRKGLTGGGNNYCFQTVEVTLRFDPKKDRLIESEAAGGKVLTAEEYHELMAAREREAAAAAEAEDAQAPGEPG
jgi:hypothetical protein